jgi:hypothetical protein
MCALAFFTGDAAWQDVIKSIKKTSSLESAIQLIVLIPVLEFLVKSKVIDKKKTV